MSILRGLGSCLALSVGLAACTSPVTGRPLPICTDPVGLSEAQPVERTGPPVAIAADCVSILDGGDALAIVFTPLPGPTCHSLAQVEVREAAQAVGVRLSAVRFEDPLAGACSPAPAPAFARVVLDTPLGDRAVVELPPEG